MAKSRGIRAGRAFIEVTAEDSKLQAGLRQADKRLKAFGNSVQALGKRLAALGTASMAALAIPTKVFASYEQQIAFVGALAREAGATEEQIASLGEKAKQLGRDTVFSASQAAEAMKVFALAGFEANQILAATGPTLDLAAAGQLDIAEAADITAKIMNNMGHSADELGSDVDILAKAMTTANTDLSMLGSAFEYVGDSAKSLKVPMEEITAAIQKLSDSGTQGERAGTSLRGILLALTSPSKEAADLLRKHNIEVEDAKGNFRGLAAVIGDFEKAFEGMGDVQRMDILGRIFSRAQVNEASNLISLGAQSLRDATEALGDSTGTAARLAEAQLDTVEGGFKILLSAIEDVAISIGEALNPVLRAASEYLSSVANVISAVVKNNNDLIIGFAKGVAIVAGLGAGLMAVGVAAKTTGFVFGVLAKAVGLVTVTIKSAILAVQLAGAAYRALKTSIVLTTVATKAFAAIQIAVTALLSPIGLLVVGVAALATWFVVTGKAGEFFGRLGETFKQVLADFQVAFGGIAAALKEGDLASAANILWLTIRLQFQRGINWINKLWQDWGTGLVTSLRRYGDSVVGRMIDLWGSAEDVFFKFTDRIMKTFNNLYGTLRRHWANIKAIFSGRFMDDQLIAEIRQIREETEAANQAIDQATAKRKADREAAKKARDNHQTAEEEARFAASRKAIEDGQKKLAQLDRELQDAVAEAKRKATPEAITAPDGATGGKPRLTPEGLDAALEQSSRKTEVLGSFSAGALRGLGGGSAADKTAKASEQTAANTAELLRRAKRQGLVITA